MKTLAVIFAFLALTVSAWAGHCGCSSCGHDHGDHHEDKMMDTM